jgi:1-acyl-sn-glycerol-3-phosphate acyltransferase
VTTTLTRCATRLGPADGKMTLEAAGFCHLSFVSSSTSAAPSTPKRSLRKQLRYWVGRTWLSAFGWKVEGGRPEARKAVLVAAPHTSGWDLPFTLAVAYSLDLEMSWVGKKELFRAPFGPFFRFLGGVPVDRSGSKGFVGAVGDLFRRSEELHLVLSPEGTRGRAARWKTGFYYMAIEADVPIILGFLDYERKVGGLGTVFRPSGDARRDLEHIRDFYATVKGKHPDQASEIKLDEESFVSPDAAKPAVTEAPSDATVGLPATA